MEMENRLPDRHPPANIGAGTYAVWRGIDYTPALADIRPEGLAPYLRRGQKALEIGCNTGRTAIWLGSLGLDVQGIDIHASAILQAREAIKNSSDKVRFLEGDFLDCTDLGKFDLVLMARVLTCFPDLADWRNLLTRAAECLADGGLFYVHDFLFTPENDAYRKRYEEGARRGWRAGNFAVPGKEGGTLFIAHHHSRDELNEIMEPYENIFLDIHDSVSLNGNVCRMFEFLGRRKSAS